MCISAERARFSGTIIYFNLLRNGKAALGYKNKAENRTRKPNAMLLTIASDEPISAKHFVDVSAYPEALDDMQKTVAASDFDGGSSLDFKSLRRGGSDVQIFTYGNYHVVSASNPLMIPIALQEVPIEKRPSISDSIFQFLKDNRPNDQVLLCCFNTHTADTIFLTYTPRLENGYYRLPGLDAHDGNEPRKVLVDVDSCVVIGATDDNQTARQVYYTNNPTNNHTVGHFFPKKVFGVEFSEKIENGDYLVPASLFNSSTRSFQVSNGVTRTWGIV